MGTETCLRLPGSNPALSVIAEQWERLALDVVSEAGSIRDVTVCQHPIFNFLRTIRRLLAENPKDQISLFFQWFPPVRCRFAAAPSQRWAGYMGGVPGCQLAKVTKATFFASGPPAAPAPVVESLIARAFHESHLVFGAQTFNRARLPDRPSAATSHDHCAGRRKRWTTPRRASAGESRRPYRDRPFAVRSLSCVGLLAPGQRPSFAALSAHLSRVRAFSVWAVGIGG